MTTSRRQRPLRLAALGLSLLAALPAVAATATAPPLSGSADLREVAGASASRFDVARIVFHPPGGTPLPVSLGTVQTVAEAGPAPLSRLRIDAVQAGDVAAPLLAFDGASDDHALGEGVVLSLKREGGGLGGRPRVAALPPGLSLDGLDPAEGVDGELAVARFHMEAERDGGALAAIGVAEGRLDVGLVGLNAQLGDRGVIARVRPDGAESRVVASLEDIDVKLGALLPGVTLPLGLSLDLATRLELPVGAEAGQAIARLVRLLAELDALDRTLAEVERARDLLEAALREDPAVAAVLDALDAAVQAVVRGSEELRAAATKLDAARTAEASAAQAVSGAEAVLSAAQADLAAATELLLAAQARVSHLQGRIAELEAEQATADPLRLLAIVGELAELQTDLAAAQADVSSAQSAKIAASATVKTSTADVESKRAALAAAQAATTAAEAALDAAREAAAGADRDLDAARVAAAAATSAAVAGDEAGMALARAAERAEDDLALVLQAVSDVLASLPPLPLLERQLDEALRDTTAVGVGGLSIASVVDARTTGGAANVACEIHDVEVLGYRPPVTTCAEILAIQRDLLDRVWALYDGLGVLTRPEGLDLQGPRGYWKPDAELDADGFQTSRARMSAVSVVVPQMTLGPVADELRAKLDDAVTVLREREAARLLLPSISPGLPVERLSVAGEDGRTLADQVDDLDAQLDELAASLEGAHTPGFSFAAASGETVARFRPAGWDGWKGSSFHPGASICDGDAACLTACLAGDCRPPLVAGETIGSGSDSVGVPLDGHGGGGLPETGWAGGLAGVALLGAGGGARMLRRRTP